jgi:hypothetical protein
MRIGQRLQRVSLTQHFVFGFLAFDDLFFLGTGGSLANQERLT